LSQARADEGSKAPPAEGASPTDRPPRLRPLRGRPRGRRPRGSLGPDLPLENPRLNKLAHELVEESALSDEHRSNELENRVKGALRRLIERIDQGYTVDVRTPEVPPKAPAGEEGADKDAAKSRGSCLRSESLSPTSVVSTRRANHGQRQAVEPSRDPLTASRPDRTLRLRRRKRTSWEHSASRSRGRSVVSTS
jgi:hypothetical protein